MHAHPHAHVHRRELVEDVRIVGCGHRYTAALTWRGEVFVWGQLGGKSWRVPTMIEALARAVVVQMACGHAHMVMVTGDAQMLQVELLRREQARSHPCIHRAVITRPSLHPRPPPKW